ncbi:MAG: hypothetical protein JWN73_3573 [Betaproteobacteria bacterium]|nr:hypothetical protein [Betaproteobacteria bacterium]
MPMWKPAAITQPFGVALASAAIGGYQRFLSPYKGYRCAYGVVHGTHGCSEAVNQ